jgi:hypothetical protein
VISARPILLLFYRLDKIRLICFAVMFAMDALLVSNSGVSIVLAKGLRCCWRLILMWAHSHSVFEARVQTIVLESFDYCKQSPSLLHQLNLPIRSRW